MIRVFGDIKELLTLEGAVAKAARRPDEADLSRTADAVLVCVEGKVVWAGSKSDFSAKTLAPWGGEAAAEFISLKGKCVLPAFVEPHTHLLFAGNRAQEFEWRIQGQSYQEISARGGGIRHTVDETRKASKQTLSALAQKRADRFLRQGVTTLEVKSGYGLDLETELRLLECARDLHGPRVVATYLGAHSRSPEFSDLDAYVRMMCEQVLPRVAREKLAARVDIYIEQGFFNLRQAQMYLDRARELGFAITAHVEQLSEMGGTECVLAYSPQSVDHVVHITEPTIRRLATSETTAVLLPTSDLYLRMKYPPARALIDAGVRVALSTDFNPGTSPTQEMSLVGVLARLEMKMSLPEVLVAYTLGAAFALGKQLEVGSLTNGKYCDFIVTPESWRDFFYGIGEHPVEQVFMGGKAVI